MVLTSQQKLTDVFQLFHRKKTPYVSAQKGALLISSNGILLPVATTEEHATQNHLCSYLC